jgi:hypothetical protein
MENVGSIFLLIFLTIIIIGAVQFFYRVRIAEKLMSQGDTIDAAAAMNGTRPYISSNGWQATV